MVLSTRYMNRFANYSEQCHPGQIQLTVVPVMGTLEKKMAEGSGHILGCVLLPWRGKKTPKPQLKGLFICSAKCPDVNKCHN